MENYYVIVIGAGNAALCAAIAAREEKANVLVLEKSPEYKRGGNSFFTDGAIRFAFDNLEGIRKVIPNLSGEEVDNIIMPSYTKESFYDDLMKATNHQSDPILANHLVNKSYETIKWMQRNKVAFDLIYDNQSFEKDGKFHFWGGLPVKTYNKGIGLIEQLNKRANELGIEVWYDSPALKINLNSANEVNGLIVEKKGKQVEVKTNSVILACGSFEGNKEMRKKYMGAEWENVILRGTEYNTGDGLKMAMEVGAQPYGQWSKAHSIGTDVNVPKVGDFSKPGDIFKKHSYPLGIIVNKKGKRFVDEGADFRNYTYAEYGREILKQPDGVAYQIYDQKVRPLLRKEYDLEEATYEKAESLEALAEKLPINKNEFLNTVDLYNKAVQDGDYNPGIKDGKQTLGIVPSKSNWAQKVNEGPFYAFPVICGITFCFGGVKSNEKAEVIDDNGKPINGLFAAGEMIGGIFYDNYPGGTGLMSGAVFGRTAGRSAANYCKSFK